MCFCPLQQADLVGDLPVFRRKLSSAQQVSDFHVPETQYLSSEELFCVSICVCGGGGRSGEGIYLHYIKRREFRPHAQEGKTLEDLS